MKDWRWATWVFPLLLAGTQACALDYDEPPINYSQMKPDDAVARLVQRLDAGTVTLTHDDHFGYLKSLLAVLDIPSASQSLVFSKTSLQKDYISPQTPRAIYFNDDTYVGTCVDGKNLEIAAVDPHIGTVFYTLEQKEHSNPRPQRRGDDCLQCHDLQSMTGGVPGLMMRSVFTDEDGQPLLTFGTYVTDQTSPWTERWGGWYVTGSQGRMRHLGNLTVSPASTPEAVDRNAGANRRDLSASIEISRFLRGSSDIVALMLLGHQTQMHNLITRAGFEARLAMRDARVMGEALGMGKGYRSDSTDRRIRESAAELVRYLLFSEEAPLVDAVAGDKDFTDAFTAHAPRDERGRSLYDLDLKRRMMRYPCSYLIYSEAFDDLPEPLLTQVYSQLLAVLTGADKDAAFSHLSADDRRAILDILIATKKGLPLSFTQARQK